MEKIGDIWGREWLCLPGSSTVGVHDRRRRSRSQGHRQRSSGLPNNKRGGRNNKYTTIIANRRHGKCGVRGELMRCYTLQTKREFNRKFYRLRTITGQCNRRGMSRVRYVRG